MKKTIVVLKFSRLSIAQKVANARFIVASMTGNEYFIAPNPLPIPPLSVITTDVDELEAAEVAAAGGSKDDTALMHAKREVLEKDLGNLAAYVQMIANDDPPLAETIVTSAGMKIRSSAFRRAKAFAVANTGTAGQLKLSTSAVKVASYIWQMCTDPVDESNWHTIKISRQCKFVKEDLMSGTRYFFRVAVVYRTGQGGWSNVLNSLVL